MALIGLYPQTGVSSDTRSVHSTNSGVDALPTSECFDPTVVASRLRTGAMLLAAPAAEEPGRPDLWLFSGWGFRLG